MKLHLSIDIPDQWITPARIHELVQAGHRMRIGIGPEDTFGVQNTLYLSALLTEVMAGSVAIVFATAIPDDGRPMVAPGIAA